MFVAGSGADQSGFANCRVADEHTFYEFLVWLFVIHVAITEAAAEWTFWNDWKVKRKFICRSDNKNLLSVECSGDWIGRVAKRNQFIRPEIELNALIRIAQGKRHKLRASLWIKKVQLNVIAELPLHVDDVDKVYGRTSYRSFSKYYWIILCRTERKNRVNKVFTVGLISGKSISASERRLFSHFFRFASTS